MAPPQVVWRYGGQNGKRLVSFSGSLGVSFECGVFRFYLHVGGAFFKLVFSFNGFKGVRSV